MKRTSKKWKTSGDRDERAERKRVIQGDIPEDFIKYYKALFVPDLIPEIQFEQMIACFKKSLPHVFRVLKDNIDFAVINQKLQEFITIFRSINVDATIVDIDQRFGVIYKLTVDNPTLRKTPELQPFREWLNNQVDQGDIVRQEFVSMIPPFFLDIHEDHSVLDCCASPGSKTTQIISQLTNGIVVANDVDLKRCCTLKRNINRYDTSKSMIICHPAQYLPDKLEFDRILADVPCSGDGTLRKNPDAILKWNLENGSSLHPLQRAILIKALKLLKVGGRFVYSTCSLNPIEDEAVINSVLLEMNGAVKLIDCRNELQTLPRSEGLISWKVFDIKEHQLIEVGKTEKNSTMFCDRTVENLNYCMRFLPHQNDSGGFFVAVMEKSSDFSIEEQKLPHKPIGKWREPPFVPLMKLNSSVYDQIKTDYGMDDAFNNDQLYVHAEDTINKIYYLSEKIKEIVESFPPEELRAVLCGSSIFSWKHNLNADNPCRAYPCIDSINIICKYASKRKIQVNINDMKLLFEAGNTGIEQETLSSYNQFVQLSVGGLIIQIPGTQFVYGAMKLGTKIQLHLGKEELKKESNKLFQHFQCT